MSNQRKTPTISLPRTIAPGDWPDLFESPAKEQIEAVLPGFLETRRWFGGKARVIDSVSIAGAVPLKTSAGVDQFLFLEVRYVEGSPERYVLPLGLAWGDSAPVVRESAQVALLASDRSKNPALLYETLEDRTFLTALFETVAQSLRLEGVNAELEAVRTQAFDSIRGPAVLPLEPSLSKAEQSNSSIRYGNRLILKLFRHLQEGINPEVEIGSFLTNRTSFNNFAPVAGTLSYRLRNGAPGSLGVLQAFVPNQGDAWKYTLASLAVYFNKVKASDPPLSAEPARSLLEIGREEVPEPDYSLIADYLGSARLLGQRTAELHIALASDPNDPDFKPQAFDRGSLGLFYAAVVQQLAEKIKLLGGALDRLDHETRELAERVIRSETQIRERLKSIQELKYTPVGIRTHGDYHLGQVLYTGTDFVIIDFEGEPARSLPDRRRKRSPLQDVAGMLRSFQYAAYMGLVQAGQGGEGKEQSGTRLEPWARAWTRYASSAFLVRYFAISEAAPIFTQEVGAAPDQDEIEKLLGVYVIEKAIYELGYEMNNRPDWVKIPLRGILDLLEFQ